MIQKIIDHWQAIAAFGAVALSSAVHGYTIVVQAGGIKNIWGKFLNGEQPSETPTKPEDPAQLKA